MFVHTCTACATRQLVFSSQVTSLVNTASGIVVGYACRCGSDQTWVTGKAVTERSQVAIAA